MKERPRSAEMVDSSQGIASLMTSVLGLLRIRVLRGVNLAVRDVRSSDPYVVVKLDKQKQKTHMNKKDVNPEWDEDLTLSLSDPDQPILLTVYDHDTFSKDDRMGDADIDAKPFIEALKHAEAPSGSIVETIQPTKENCLACDSQIRWNDRRLVQDMCDGSNFLGPKGCEIHEGLVELPVTKVGCFHFSVQV